MKYWYFYAEFRFKMYFIYCIEVQLCVLYYWTSVLWALLHENTEGQWIQGTVLEKLNKAEHGMVKKKKKNHILSAELDLDVKEEGRVWIWRGTDTAQIKWVDKHV